MSGDYVTNGYALSSWNYGSFYHCSPFNLRNEYIQGSKDRAKSAGFKLNKYGKRNVPEEERIVRNDLLQVMQEYNVIKYGNPEGRCRSENKFGTREDVEEEEGEELERLNFTMESKMKSFKFKMTYEEWYCLKKQQEDIMKKVQMIKENEIQQLEEYNKQVDEEYKKVKEDLLKKWVAKKNIEKLSEYQKKNKEEEVKMENKIEKENIKREKMEQWFMKQAQKMEDEFNLKKYKQILQNEEKLKKEEDEERKKERSEIAYQKWLLRKKKEEKLKSKNKKSMRSSNNKLGKKTKSEFSINIGPYTYSKDLRDFQKKYLNDSQKSYSMKKSKVSSKRNNISGGDSFQELSSIKKETPPIQNEEELEHY